MDSRRRNISSRPLSSEEVECWGGASASLGDLSAMYLRSGSAETIGKVNRLISVWPTDDNLLAEGLAPLKTIQTKLSSGLNEIINQANKEVRMLEDALERVDVLIALRKATESAEKRNKRPRAPSPSGTPIPAQSSLGNTRSVSITLPPRTNSVGPRDSRTKKELGRQPLQVGRKVVFRPPKGADAEEGTWIVAVITRGLSKDGKYEVQDVEPQEDGQTGAVYMASTKSIVPLPDEMASAGSPAHLSLYPTFAIGSTVLALYPDTSCFYRAQVISVPHQDKSSSSKYAPSYRVKFEDDEDMVHTVSAYWVVQFPNHLLGNPKQSGLK